MKRIYIVTVVIFCMMVFVLLCQTLMENRNILFTGIFFIALVCVGILSYILGKQLAKKNEGKKQIKTWTIPKTIIVNILSFSGIIFAVWTVSVFLEFSPEKLKQFTVSMSLTGIILTVVAVRNTLKQRKIQKHN